MIQRQVIMTLFLVMSLMINCCPSWGQSYRLAQVTSVEDGGLYVFKINGRVLGNSVSSNGLQTNISYNTSNLTGSETYVWKLEKTTGGYYMRNMSISGSNCYLKNTSSNLLGFGSKSSKWTFHFTNDSTTIQLSDSRYIADAGVYGDPYNTYKLYTQTNAEKAFHHFIVYQLVGCGTASITSAEYATFSSEYALDFSGEEGLKVYTAEVNETKTKVMLREVTSKRVPANTAVVLHGAAGSYTGSIIADADAITGNDLQIASEAMTGNGKIYVLNRVDGVVGFYKLKSSGTLAKGKAYITLEGNTGAPMLSMSEDLEVTAIEMLPTDACQYQKGYYTLDGRLVERPTKGVYVVDGRKIVVK